MSAKRKNTTIETGPAAKAQAVTAAQADAEKIFAAAVAAIGAPRALVLEEARKCSLTRLRNLVKKQDPSVAWYAFGRKSAEDWLAKNATIAVFGLKIKKT